MSKTNLALQPLATTTITVEPSCEIATDLAILKEAGFKIIKNSDGSRLVCLPAGWTICEHSTWHALLDDQGRERGLILKSTLCAHQILFLRCCFEIAIRPFEGTHGPINYVMVINHDVGQGHEDNAASRCTIAVYGDDHELDPRLSEDFYHGMAESYLNKKYPDWRNPLAYWRG